MRTKSTSFRAARKAPTGIEGFAEISRGGLLRHCTTLLPGGTGSGKTVLALPCVAHRAAGLKVPFRFVTLAKNSRRIIGNRSARGRVLASLGLFLETP